MAIAKKFHLSGMTRLRETCYQVASWLLAYQLARSSVQVLAALLANASSLSNISSSLDIDLQHHLFVVKLVLTLLCFLFCRSRYNWLSKSRLHGAEMAPVHHGRDPILGLDWLRQLQMALQEHRFLDLLGGCFERTGPTFWAPALGSWSLYTRDHEVVKAMYGTHKSDWVIGGARLRATALALGRHSIFAINDAEWKHARDMIRPAFVRNQIADLECAERHVQNLLRSLPCDGATSVDVQDLLYRFTIDISTDFMFGHSTNILTDPRPQSIEFSRCFDRLLFTAATQSRTGWFSIFSRDPDSKRTINVCKEFVSAHVDEALFAQEKTKERPYIFMDELIKSGATKEEVQSQLLSMIVGGRDTGASTLSSMLWVLARRPDIVAKICDELAVLDGKRPTWEELRNLKYLNNVMKETLRLYAPVPTNSRVASRDTVLPRGGGQDGNSPLFVPRGTSCRFSTYHIHRDRRFYGQDADEFRPERWNTLRPTWEYIPFAGGPRICIGQQFALTQMMYLTTRLFQTFSAIEPVDDRPMVQQIGTTIHLVNGCWIRLKPARLHDELVD